jgi:hypothetical protein
MKRNALHWPALEAETGLRRDVELELSGRRLRAVWPCDCLGRELAKPTETWTFPDEAQADAAFDGFAETLEA